MENNETATMAYALSASTLSLIAFLIYNWKILLGKTKPNISSWMVWGFLVILNFTSYKALTNDWVKSILPTANTLMTLVTLAFALRTGSFKNLDNTEIKCLSIGLLSGLVWWIVRSAGFAQVLVQIAIFVGFIPTFRGTYKNPKREPWLPWMLWTLSYVAQFFAIKITWTGEYIEFIYPTLLFFCHGAVYCLALRKK